MLFTDTGSVPYEINSEDVYEEFFKHKHLFDFRNYLKDSEFFLRDSKMKEESEGKIIDEFKVKDVFHENY